MELVLLLGGNSGNRLELLRRAIDEISNRIGVVLITSSVYETEPWGFETENTFYNIALKVDTKLTPIQALNEALMIESDLGRVRSGAQGYESRPMDIDIILCNDMVIDTERLVVPHPRMCERRFVMVPVAQIVPESVHPIRKLSMRTLLAQCKDSLSVKKVGEIFGLKE